MINTLEATTDADAAADVDDPAGTVEYTTTNAGAGYVDALAAVRRAERGERADFDEVYSNN